MNYVFAETTVTEFVGLVVLAASFVVACGVVWRAIKNLWRAIHRIEARIKRLHELSEPDDETPHGGIP